MVLFETDRREGPQEIKNLMVECFELSAGASAKGSLYDGKCKYSGLFLLVCGIWCLWVPEEVRKNGWGGFLSGRFVVNQKMAKMMPPIVRMNHKVIFHI